MTLAELRARGLSIEGGLRLRVVGPASVVAEFRPALEANRDGLLDALQDEAEDEVVTWPVTYRKWLVQTVAYCLREGMERRAAWWMACHDVRREYSVRRAEVATLPLDDQMLAAAIDSGLVLDDGKDTRLFTTERPF